MRDFGITGWGFAIASLAFFLFTSAVHFFRRHLLLEREGETSRSGALWIFGGVTTVLTALLLALSLFGVLGGPSYRL